MLDYRYIRGQDRQNTHKGRHGVTFDQAIEAVLGRRRLSKDDHSAIRAYTDAVGALISGDPIRVSQAIVNLGGGEVPCTPELAGEFLGAADQDLEEALHKLLSKLFSRNVEMPSAATPKHRPELYTMHGAKGLTRRHIIIPACENMFLPNTSPGTDSEEQKRLFYVAITRARESLFITHPRSRTGKDPLYRGQLFNRRVSPFAERMGIRIITLN